LLKQQVVSIDETETQYKLTLTPDNGDEPITYTVSKRMTLLVEDGQSVELGTPSRGPH
jgi:DNA-directed RNA polymerase subunit beta'